MKLFVAKLNRDVEDEHLVELFSEYGEVAYARVITDRDTGQSKCFGFVQMRNEAGGRAAMEALNGYTFRDFEMVVKEAEQRPRDGSPRPSRTDSRPRTESPGNRSSAGGAPRGGSERATAPSPPDAASDSFSRDARKKTAPKKGKSKGGRDIYADGAKPAKMGSTKTKNTDWLDDLDDF